jgi:hypothetical protein
MPAATSDPPTCGRTTTANPYGPRTWHRVLAYAKHFAQRPRSNYALRTRTSHHAPALRLWWNALLGEGMWWSGWRGSLDGMQGVRGSNPLSSTRHNTSAALPLRAICQQIVSRSRIVTVGLC